MHEYKLKKKKQWKLNKFRETIFFLRIPKSLLQDSWVAQFLMYDFEPFLTYLKDEDTEDKRIFEEIFLFFLFYSWKILVTSLA